MIWWVGAIVPTVWQSLFFGTEFHEPCSLSKSVVWSWNLLYLQGVDFISNLFLVVERDPFVIGLVPLGIVTETSVLGLVHTVPYSWLRDLQSLNLVLCDVYHSSAKVRTPWCLRLGQTGSCHFWLICFTCRPGRYWSVACFCGWHCWCFPCMIEILIFLFLPSLAWKLC